MNKKCWNKNNYKRKDKISKINRIFVKEEDLCKVMIILKKEIIQKNE
jgi:hypothetical protein